MSKRLLARLKKDERGLTLVELLAVIVILAIVGGIGTVLIGNIVDNAKKDAHIANALQMIAAAKLYEVNGKEISGSITLETLQTEGVLGTVVDPWTKTPYGSGRVTKVVSDGTVTYRATLPGTNCNLSAATGIGEDRLLKGRGSDGTYACK